MVPPLQPPPDESRRTSPLLPSTGADAESVFDLPYAVDELPAPPLPPPPPPTPLLPPPPDAVLPSTFSTPRSFSAPPPDQAATAAPVPTRGAANPHAPLPAPIDAGPLSGSRLFEDDEDDTFAPSAPPQLPPMVAKGGWSYFEDADLSDGSSRSSRTTPADRPDRTDRQDRPRGALPGRAAADTVAAPPSESPAGLVPDAGPRSPGLPTPVGVGGASGAPGAPAAPDATAASLPTSPPPNHPTDIPALGHAGPASPPAPSLMHRLSEATEATARDGSWATTPTGPPESDLPSHVWDPPPAVVPPAPVPSPPSEALSFSPDPSRAEDTAPTTWSATAGAPTAPQPQAYATIAPLAPTPDPRRMRGPARVISETRLGDGLLVSAAAAAVAGVIWWAVVALTQRQFVYLAILLGVLIGQAALVGGRRGSLGLGLVAAALTLLSLTATQYFITRSLAISELGADMPLWDGSTAFVDIVRGTIEDDPLTGVFVLLAAGVAGFQAGLPGRRASGPLGEVHVSRAPDKIL